MRKASEPPLPVALTVDPPEVSRFGLIFNAGGAAISPDGRTLAFVATNAKGERLLLCAPAGIAGGASVAGDGGGGAAVLVAAQQVAGICGRRKVEAN